MIGWLGSRWVVALALLALVAVYAATQLVVVRDPRARGSLEDIRAFAQRDDTNVLFILIDTLRADRLRCYGYERETSPGLDYLANSGVRFAQHRAQSSWTKTSMASLWTSLYPARTGVLRYSDVLSPEARVPAEVLKDLGLRTGGIWRNGWVAPNFGFGQGFDLYQNPFIRQAPKDIRRKPRAGLIEGTDIDLVFSALEFMRVHADERWLLYVHFMDVHQYVTVEELAIFGSDYSDSYDNAILWTDKQVRALYGALDQLGLRERTLVAIVSDHGEAFGEHGREGHGRDLFGEVTLTPFILSFPFRLEPGLVVEAPSQNVDVWPTILDLLGAPPLEPSDGRSLVPQILGEGEPPEDVDLAQLDRSWGRVGVESSSVVALRERNLRLHYAPGTDERALYDLSMDPGERNDLAAELPEDARRLEARARVAAEASVAWQGGTPTVELDEMNLKQLRALGYVVQ